MVGFFFFLCHIIGCVFLPAQGIRKGEIFMLA